MYEQRLEVRGRPVVGLDFCCMNEDDELDGEVHEKPTTVCERSTIKLRYGCLQ